MIDKAQNKKKKLAKIWMLGHCCGAIHFPVCDLNKKL
jgi:hypothetical protein